MANTKQRPVWTEDDERQYQDARRALDVIAKKRLEQLDFAKEQLDDFVDEAEFDFTHPITRERMIDFIVGSRDKIMEILSPINI